MTNSLIVAGGASGRIPNRYGFGGNQSTTTVKGRLGKRAAERSAFHELHHQVVGSDVVQSADVGVVEPGDDGRLTREPVGERLVGHLDCDRSIQAAVGRPLDLAHASGGDHFVDFVRAEARPVRQGHERRILAARSLSFAKRRC